MIIKQSTVWKVEYRDSSNKSYVILNPWDDCITTALSPIDKKIIKKVTKMIILW